MSILNILYFKTNRFSIRRSDMLYDFHTYDLKPRTVAELEERVAEVLPTRLEISPLGGFWHTEAGPLNQIIHIWPMKAWRTARRRGS